MACCGKTTDQAALLRCINCTLSEMNANDGYDIVCASTDGRLLRFNEQTGELSELNGDPVTDGATATSCPDYEILCSSVDGRPLLFNTENGELTELNGDPITDGSTAVTCAEQPIQEIRACLITEYNSFGSIESNLDALTEAAEADASDNANINSSEGDSQIALASINQTNYLANLNANHGGGWEVVDGVLVQNPATLTTEIETLTITPEDDPNNRTLRRDIHVYKKGDPIKVIQLLNNDASVASVRVYTIDGATEVVLPLQDNQSIDLQCPDMRTEWQTCMLDRLPVEGSSERIEMLQDWQVIDANSVRANFQTPEGTVHDVRVDYSSGGAFPFEERGIQANRTGTSNVTVTVTPPFPSVSEVLFQTYDMDENAEYVGNFSLGEGGNFTGPGAGFAKTGPGGFWEHQNGANSPEARFNWVLGGGAFSGMTWQENSISGAFGRFDYISFYTNPSDFDTVEFTRVFKKDCNTDTISFQDHENDTGDDHILRDGAAAIPCDSSDWSSVGETCFLDNTSNEGFVQQERHTWGAGERSSTPTTWSNDIDYCLAYEVNSTVSQVGGTWVTPFIYDPYTEALSAFGAAVLNMNWVLAATNGAVLSRVTLRFRLEEVGNTMNFYSNPPDLIVGGDGGNPIVTATANDQEIVATWFTWPGSTSFQQQNSPNVTPLLIEFTYDITFPSGSRGLVTVQQNGLTGELRYIDQASGREVQEGCLLTCPTRGLARSTSPIVLCDDNGSFLRNLENDGEGRLTVTDYELDGETIYQTVGEVHRCCCETFRTIETCFTPDDPTLNRRQLYGHYITDSEDGLDTLLGYTETQAHILPYVDPDTLDGGGELTEGECPCCQIGAPIEETEAFGNLFGEGLTSGPQVTGGQGGGGGNPRILEQTRYLDFGLENCVFPVRYRAERVSGDSTLAIDTNGGVSQNGATGAGDRWNIRIEWDTPLDIQLSPVSFQGAGEIFDITPATGNDADDYIQGPGAPAAYVNGNYSDNQGPSYMRFNGRTSIEFNIRSQVDANGVGVRFLTIPTAAQCDCSCGGGGAAAAAAATVNNIAVTRQTVTNAGSTAAGLQSVSFVNVAGAAVTVAGQQLLPGEDVNFEAYLDPVTNQFRRLDPIAYDATGGSLRINSQP